MSIGDGHNLSRKSEYPYARRLLSDSIRSIGPRYALFITATALFGLATLLPAQFFRYFAESSQTLSTLSAKNFLLHFLTFGLLVSVTLLVSSTLTALIQEWLRLRVEANLREKVIRRLHEIPLSHIDASQRGDWMTRVTGDLGRTEGFLTESLPEQIRQISIVLGVSILFVFESGWLSLLPLGGALIIAGLNLWVQMRLSPVLYELRTLHAGIFQMLIESFEGVRTIRSHRAEPFVLRRFQNRLLDITSKSMQVVRYLGALIGGTEFVGQILITLCLTSVALALTRNEITLQQALTYPFFIGLFYGAVQRLASGAYEWNRFLIEAGRLGSFLFHDTDQVSGLVVFNSEASVQKLKVSATRVGYLKGPMTEAISFSVETGECVAIIGPSGVGKSTFLEVLAGLRPALSGSAALLDRNGRELWQEKGTWTLPIKFCAYVEQRPYIFEGSLRENLTLGNPLRLSDAVLWDFLTRVGLESFTHSRGGLDHTLSDRGRNLSEGERYRIALCRALLLSRPFLLVDEPFASLDTLSMEVVVTMLNAEKTRTGIVIVTHFLPQSLSYDSVIDFTHYKVQRRSASLFKPEIPSSLEGSNLSFQSLGKNPAISTNERKII